MEMTDAKVLRVPLENPGDISGIENKIRKGEVNPKDIVAIIGKTRGEWPRNRLLKRGGIVRMRFPSL